MRCYFDNEGTFVQSEKLEVQQSEREAEMAQIDWLIQYLPVLNKHEMCLNIVYSGDIDALILHMFTLSYLWPRYCNDAFKHEVFLLLVKPTTKDLYNITAIIRLLEKTYKDKHMALKMAIFLCIGGNGVIPKFCQIIHKSFVERILMSENVRSGLIQITMGDEQDCPRCRIQINKELYKELIKEMYCPKYLYHHHLHLLRLGRCLCSFHKNRVAMSIEMQEIGYLQHQW